MDHIMNRFGAGFDLAVRVLLAQIFILSGASKIGAYAGTQAYMTAYGVPGELLPLAIAAELGGGLALAAGLYSRWVALALAGFTLVATGIFHFDFADQAQTIAVMKNVAIIGGLLLIVRDGAGRLSLDGWRAPENTALSA
jgi:putative oxidoreductase